MLCYATAPRAYTLVLFVFGTAIPSSSLHVWKMLYMQNDVFTTCSAHVFLSIVNMYS